MIHKRCRPILIVILSISLNSCDGGGDGWIPKDLGGGPRACDGGRAGFFPCSGISLEKRVSLEELGGGVAGNDNSELAEIGFFDTFPVNDASGFSGAWGVYPYLPSGIVVVSDTINGLFVLSIDDLQ